MHIETPKKKLDRSDKTVYEFLTDVKNFELLMPDTKEKFEVIDSDTFKFALKGMPEITLNKKEQQPNSKIVFGAAGGKLPFTLSVDIQQTSDASSEVQMAFEGEFNAMMAMMIKGPITNFMGTLSENLDVIPQ